ncbi:MULTISPECIES: spore germination protein [Lysinibacillus]|uniref:Spore germination protein n=1 Tax=Lysinibacillus antri TaxID=2498145 RepID=A0A432LEA3_9BACI|nr:MULTISPECIES: spore germination protein [Lysinibacillus]RUL55084.1 spore germination protein [Lysinibacillus antri]TSI10086.1 spore germination protein [Lysinibacillus sp. BW-2-10]
MSNKIFASLDEAKDFLYGKFGKDESFDICIKDLHVRDLPILCVYISGLVDGATITVQLTPLLYDVSHGVDSKQEIKDEAEYFNNHFNFYGKSEPKDKNEFLLGVLSGQVGIITQSGYGYVLELRSYPGRQPDEPDNEKVIRGSRDGFAENIMLNTALIRRRIRDPQLRFELHKISTLGQTDVAIAYMKDIVNTKHLKWIKKRLKEIQHDGLTMSDKSLEEWLFKQRFHPLPFVRYSERPDIVAAHLLEGHIAIIVDTSPSVIIVPISMFHLLQHAEEYRQAPFIGTGIRLLRYTAAILTLTLLPIWYLLATHEEYLPKALEFIGSKEKSTLPLFLQIIIAHLGLEYLRIAAIHTPTPLSTAMGLVAGIIIGQIAIDVGLFSPEVVLYTAVTAIFSFSIPTYELSSAMKYFQFFIIIATAVAGVSGFFISLFLIFSYLCALKPMQVPYMWPLVPFFPKAFTRVFIRFPMADDAIRPYLVGAKQRKRA